MRILFAGGGTLGSVSPLLAVWQVLREYGAAECSWVGTTAGPEGAVIAAHGIPFQAIVAPKLRRYADWRTPLVPIPLLIGVVQARSIIKRFAPDVVVSAGSFVAVPVGIAARTRRVPLLIHQQDVVPGLANRMLAPLASAITAAFPSTAAMFPAKKTLITGNPVRADIRLADRGAAAQLFRLSPAVPTLLVIGGGTGAATLNQLVWDGLSELVATCQVIHVTGRGKMSLVAEHPRYRAFEFLDADLGAAYAIADLVVSRAGMGALSELAALSKPTIVVPIPGSHQLANAVQFAKFNAAIIFEQTGATAEDFVRKIRETITDRPLLSNLSRNIGKVMAPDAALKVADVVRRLVGDA